MKYLSQGLKQHAISEKLKKNGFTPSSVSSVEKMCFALRKKHKAKTNFHLAVKLCKKGLI